MLNGLLQIPMGHGLTLIIQLVQQWGTRGNVEFEHVFSGELIQVHHQRAQTVPVGHHQRGLAVRQSRLDVLLVIGNDAFGGIL